MKKNSTFPIYLGLVLLLITISILSTQTVSAAALSSIQIQPVTPARLLAGQTLQLKATGTYSDGSTADITSKVTWSISNTSVAKISATGLVSIVESAGGPGRPAMPGGAMPPGDGRRPEGGPDMPGGPGGPGGPDGNKPPPVEGGFETSFVSPLFGDNMVLQRGKPNTIWGWAKIGQEIRVTIADNTVKTVTKDDGRWSAVIEPPAPGGPYTVVIDGPQHVEFHEVLVGDVWLCGGQSNMEMGLGQARNGSEEVKAADHPRIRLFVVKQQTARKPAAIPQGSWKICSPQNVGEGWSGFSAVAYFFGRRLQQEVDVPIGLVEDCVGGAPAEAWTRAETLRSLGISDTGSGPNTPVVLYNGMIAPVAPLAISGAIWYQGESNTERATQYRKMLPAMIADWRRAFKQGDFPFYIVSLAAHKQHKDTPGDDSWAELRAAQDFVANTVTNSGLAVAIDVGDARDVHPKDKKEVGERLALLALARHYGKNIPYSGPRFASEEKVPGALKISFTHTGGGLVVKGDKLEEFSVCGEDRKWHWADARIVGETVVVSSSEVPNPVAARYAWQANPKATLFNGAALPAIPFRTDYVGGMNDPGMPEMPSGPRSGNRSRPAGGPSPGDGAGGPDGPPPDGDFGGSDGPPPDGNFGSAGGMPAGSVVLITATLAGVTSPPISLTVMTTEGPAIYSQSGGTVAKSNQTITTSDKSTSGVKITDKGTFTLSDSNVTTSGNTTAMENSSFYGLNAAVLALSGSKITMTNGTITTRGTGANGAFAVGKGSVVELSKVKIDCLASGAHGVDATIAGTIICTDVDITTAGNGAAAAISTDRGGGTVTFTRGSAATSGTRSPGIYSTGSITVSNAKITTTGSEAIVIEGKNFVTLTNTTLSCLKECGSMLYQSFSGDAGVGTSILTMTGGSLTAAEGPMFYITNTSAVVDIKGDAKLSAASGTLINAAAGRWGNTGSNGGRLTFKADGEFLTGDIVCDNISSVTATLQNKTTLKGTINTEGTAKVMALTLDTTSIWEVTGTSYLTTLTDQDVTLANIHDNGHTIYYDLKADVNKWLGGKTHPLAGGGKLTGR